MTELFLKIVNMSIMAGWLVLVVLVARLLLKRAPKWISCLLWALVAVRLVCPVSLESVFSLMPDALVKGDIVSEWTDDYIGKTWMIHDNSTGYGAAVDAGREPLWAGEGRFYVVTAYDWLSEPATVANTVVPVLAWFWLAGVAAMLLYTLFSFLCLKKQVRTAAKLCDNIYQSETAASPFVLGIFRPRIYVPFSMEEKTMAFVLAHEQAHIRRCDHLVKLFAFLLLSVYWFHPLLWLAYILLCRDIELACDERVVKNFGTEECADYSEALLSCSAPRKRITACPLAFGETGLKQRVKNVLAYKKPAVWVLILALPGCLILALCFLTNPKRISLTDFGLPPAEKASEVETLELSSPYRTISLFGADLIEPVLAAMEEVTVSGRELSRSRDEKRSKDFVIAVNCDIAYGVCYFNKDFTEVWVDDGVKPSFTYRITSAEKLKREILRLTAYGELRYPEEGVELVLGETYIVASCIYMNPFSSYMPLVGDYGYRYTFEEETFTKSSRDGSSPKTSFPVTTDWKWQEFPYTDKEWNAMFEIAGLGIANPSTVYEEMLYLPLARGYTDCA